MRAPAGDGLEFRLACACCVGWRVGADREGMRAILRERGFDGARFLRIIDRHRIAGLAQLALGGVEDVPDELRRELAGRAKGFARTNLGAAVLAGRLCRALEEGGVRVVVMKGAALAVEAYGLLEARQSKDIDLRVGVENVDAAVAILREAGLQRVGPRMGSSAGQERLWRRYRKDFQFRQEGSGLEVELHWRVVENAYLVPACFPGWDVVRVAVGPSIELPCLSRRAQLPYLLVHGATHGWPRLKWLADVAALVEGMDAGEVRAVIGDGERDGMGAMMQQGLHLSAELLGVPAAGVLPAMDWRVRCLAGVGRTAVRAGGDVEEMTSEALASAGVAASQFLLGWGVRFWLREGFLRMNYPEGWERAGVPAGLQGFYFLVRVPVWAARQLRLWFAAQRRAAVASGRSA
jgi:hypothetical protein